MISKEEFMISVEVMRKPSNRDLREWARIHLVNILDQRICLEKCSLKEVFHLNLLIYLVAWVVVEQPLEWVVVLEDFRVLPSRQVPVDLVALVLAVVQEEEVHNNKIWTRSTNILSPSCSEAAVEECISSKKGSHHVR